MLSRVAESIYWMARYVERAENLARFIDVSQNMMLDQPDIAHQQWQPLIFATGDQEEFKKRYGTPDSENVIHFLVFDRNYTNSIISSLVMARENARSVREVISSEAWEQLNEFYHFVRDSVNNHRPAVELNDFFTAIKERSHLFNGTLDATMSHNKGWHFANLGRLLERADKTSRILDVKYFTLLPHVQDVGTTVDDLQWSSVLRSVSAFEMYRKRFHSITIHRVVEFLTLDQSFPRAVRFCIDHADDSLHQIVGSPSGTYRNTAEQKLGRLRAELAYTDVHTIVNQGIHEFIDGLQTRLNSIGEAIHETFFALRPVEQSQRQSQQPMQQQQIQK
ncbi:alpha-E domain-containing protein [Planctomicrobium sp. SH527]|uniref:alpha-E domain-containing protein n=1 Tax=Planctomicrobium sp. SH527 TaxID=3448123 RepID=UPI003F5C1281